MPPFWWVAPAAVGAFTAVCVLAVLLYLRTARRLDRKTMPVDDMVDVVSGLQVFPEGNPNLPADWAQRPDLHHKDCACDPCWVVRMRDIAARQAAELNTKGKLHQ